MFLRLWITLLLCCGANYAHAQQEGFPFLATVKAEKVNVRAGQSTNFEKIGQLVRGDQVVVVGKEFSWYKIKLPRNAQSFITDKYVQTEDHVSGVVTADRVNVRALKDSNSSSLGQVMKGTTVKILETHPGWYKIEPLEESFGWIAEEFVEFTSKDVSSYTSAPPVAVVAVKENVVAPKIEEKKDTVVKTYVSTGFLETFKGDETSSNAYYRLVVDGQPAYLIKIDSHLLDAFVSYKVSIEGVQIPEPPISTYLPVLSISKIQLIL